MEHTHTKRYRDCLELYIQHGGVNLSRIEREMRALGHADFNRRILYSRLERGKRKPGWIERYGWTAGTNSRRTAGTLACPDASASVTSRYRTSAYEVKAPPTGPRSDASFQAWLKSVSPDMTWDWKYQTHIYEHLQRVTDGECKRLMIFMPPRHGKSELVTVRYAGWRLRQDPKMHVILASYSQSLANKFSRSVRKILSEEEDRLNTPSEADTDLGGRRPADGVVGSGFQSSPPYKGGVATVSVDGVVLSETADHQHANNLSENHPPAEAVPVLRKEGSLMSSDNSARQPATSGQRTVETQIPQRMFPKTRTINTVAEWETAAGGGVKAVGVGAGVTGFGAQLIVIDDPVKSRAEAESQTYRDRLWDWYNNDLYTRLEPGAAMVLIQTRWHEDDLAGRLLKDMEDGGDKWDVINLPAIAEIQNEEYRIMNNEDPASAIHHSSFDIHHSTDPLGREPGVALYRARYDETKLADIKRQIGTYPFSALFQQRPTPAEGGIFKRSWFTRFVDKAPDGLKWKRGYDLAVSTKTSACYTASFRIAFDADGNLYIADGFRKRIEFPDQRRYIESRIKEEKDTEHGIEKALHGQALLQDLRRTARIRGTHLRGVDTSTDKLTRALKWSPIAEEGKVVLVKSHWNEALIQEACLFPAGKFDDQIDAISIAFSMFAQRNRNAWFF